VSCASPGDCAAGGRYVDASGNYQAYVASERNGVWGKAIEVPGLGRLNRGGVADFASVSCASPGSCAVVGDYRAIGCCQFSGRPVPNRVFVVSENNGVWRRATEVPGLRP
jgi:hypothetical protein